MGGEEEKKVGQGEKGAQEGVTHREENKGVKQIKEKNEQKEEHGEKKEEVEQKEEKEEEEGVEGKEVIEENPEEVKIDQI